MNLSPLIFPSEEYKTLISELHDSKKYVFERPLLTVGALLAIANFAGKEEGLVLHSFLPPICVALLYFNLWFTVNRLRSTSRIVAYIQLVLEENRLMRWRGWESFLMETRKIKNKSALEKYQPTTEEESNFSNNFYTPIYYFHITVVLIALIASILIFYVTLQGKLAEMELSALLSGSDISFLLVAFSSLSTLVLLGFFIKYLFISGRKSPKPKNIQRLIESATRAFKGLIDKLNEEEMEKKVEVPVDGKRRTGSPTPDSA